MKLNAQIKQDCAKAVRTKRKGADAFERIHAGLLVLARCGVKTVTIGDLVDVANVAETTIRQYTGGEWPRWYSMIYPDYVAGQNETPRKTSFEKVVKAMRQDGIALCHLSTSTKAPKLSAYELAEIDWFSDDETDETETDEANENETENVVHIDGDVSVSEV